MTSSPPSDAVTTDGAERGRLVAVNGVDLYAREMGQGQPVVLVQPGLVTSGVYANVAARLAERFRVVTVDADDRNAVDSDAFAEAHASSLLPLLRRSHPDGEEQ